MAGAAVGQETLGEFFAVRCAGAEDRGYLVAVSPLTWGSALGAKLFNSHHEASETGRQFGAVQIVTVLRAVPLT